MDEFGIDWQLKCQSIKGRPGPWVPGTCLGTPAAGWLLTELQVNLHLDTGLGEENLMARILPDLCICAS